jgi:uncharacterized FlaG/YvyC family protein
MKKQKQAYHEMTKETTDTRKKLNDALDETDRKLEQMLEKLKKAKESLYPVPEKQTNHANP